MAKKRKSILLPLVALGGIAYLLFGKKPTKTGGYKAPPREAQTLPAPRDNSNLDTVTKQAIAGQL